MDRNRAPDHALRELRAIHDLPFFDLLIRAHEVHRAHHDPRRVQLCTLLSVKTGGCSEDCGYCSQSGHHKTGVKPSPLLPIDEVVAKARAAKENGSTRFCMGAAWKNPKSEREFGRVLEMVGAVSKLGLETCVTLGMLTEEQARALKAAGLTAYNHNLDTGPAHYENVVTTHTYADRLQTLAFVRDAGIKICSGGIVGLGESVDDRLEMLAILASFRPPPESVPINTLVPVSGTPLSDAPKVDALDVVRMIATTRIALPASRVRLSAGRRELSSEAHALAFFAGANSIFLGDELLTTQNREPSADHALLSRLGLLPEA